MWIDKLRSGVLELETPIGPRYLEPNFLGRARLLWTFRNFTSLPHQVLRPSEVRLIDGLLNENRFLSGSAINAHDRPVIGRVERPLIRLQSDEFSTEKQRVGTSGLAAEDGFERAA